MVRMTAMAALMLMLMLSAALPPVSALETTGRGRPALSILDFGGRPDGETN
eukprot:SAG22_NODE_9642_length_577_cov_2.202929_1_plen_50_part_01